MSQYDIDKIWLIGVDMEHTLLIPRTVVIDYGGPITSKIHTELLP